MKRAGTDGNRRGDFLSLPQLPLCPLFTYSRPIKQSHGPPLSDPLPGIWVPGTQAPLSLIHI